MRGSGRVALVVAVGIAAIIAVAYLALRETPGGRPPASSPHAISTSRGGTAPAGRIETPLVTSSSDPPRDAAPPANVRGRVLGPSGKPVEAEMIATPQIEGQGNHVEARSGSDGVFMLCLPPGDWLVWARDVDSYGMTAVKVPAEGVVEADVTLQEGAIVSGSVLDFVGKPVAGARVLDEAGNLGAVSDEQGRYSVVAMPPATTLMAKANGAVSVLSELRVVPGEKYTLDLHLGRALSISGKVADTTGAPIAGATVEHEVVDLDGGGMRSTPPGELTTKTDPDGHYAIEGIEKGTHHLSARADGFMSEWADGEAGATDVNFTLARGGRIAGKVVRKATGEPVENASVDYHPAGDLIRWTRHHVSDRTRPDGSFLLAGVEPGRVVLKVDAPGLAVAYSLPIEVTIDAPIEGVRVELLVGGTLRGLIVSAADGRPVGGARLLRLYEYDGADQEEKNVSHQFEEVESDTQGLMQVENLPAGTLRLRIRHPDYISIDRTIEIAEGQVLEERFALGVGAQIHGRVFGKDGKPMKRVLVWATSPQAAPQKAEADEEGRYEVEELSAGPWSVIAVQEAENGGEGDITLGLRQVDLKEGQDLEVDFSWNGGIRLHGVVRKGGRALPDQVLQFIPLSGGVPAKCTTDASGNYEVALLAPGEYLMAVDTVTARVTVPQGVLDLAHDFDLPAGGVSGAVYDARMKAPIAGARVVAVRSGLPTGGMAELLQIAAAGDKSGPDGRYELAGLPPGDYLIAARAEGHPIQVAARVVVSEGAEQVQDLFLDAGTKVRGWVVDTGGAPVRDAKITIRDAATGVPLVPDAQWTAISDERGEVSLGEFAPGEYVVTLHASGLASARTRVRVVAGKEEVFKVAMVPPGSLHLRVEDASGAPLARARLGLWDLEGLAVDRPLRQEDRADPFQGASDAGGGITREDLAPGHYRGEVALDGRHATFEVDVVAAQATEARVVIPTR